MLPSFDKVYVAVVSLQPSWNLAGRCAISYHVAKYFSSSTCGTTSSGLFSPFDK